MLLFLFITIPHLRPQSLPLNSHSNLHLRSPMSRATLVCFASLTLLLAADKLMTTEDSKWVFKNKDHGQMAAAASLGMVHLWNESQLSELDKFLHAEEVRRCAHTCTCGQSFNETKHSVKELTIFTHAFVVVRCVCMPSVYTRVLHRHSPCILPAYCAAGIHSRRPLLILFPRIL